MKVCIVVEGCYPYVTGGVSSWVHGLIQSFPKLEFIILAIISNRSLSGKFTYELPENVSEVHELYLEDADWNRKGRRRCRLSKAEYQAFRSLVRNRRVEWETVFRMFQEKPISLDKFLMGEDFLKIVRESYDMHYSQLVFSDYLWTDRKSVV